MNNNQIQLSKGFRILHAVAGICVIITFITSMIGFFRQGKDLDWMFSVVQLLFGISLLIAAKNGYWLRGKD